MALSFTIPFVVGATIGYVTLRGAPELLTLSVLAVTGGALTSVVVEEMITEAHEGDTSRLGPVYLTAGFAIFALVSVYVGRTISPSLSVPGAALLLAVARWRTATAGRMPWRSVACVSLLSCWQRCRCWLPR